MVRATYPLNLTTHELMSNSDKHFFKGFEGLSAFVPKKTLERIFYYEYLLLKN